MCAQRIHPTHTLTHIESRRNVVIDNTVDESAPDKPQVGMVVIRGNSIVLVEALERV
jgi:small nuclear ribonucleoprotein G